MKTRAAKFVAATIASILSSANALAAPEDAASENTQQPVEQCLTSPRDYTPPGTRWRYRVERSTGRHCWFLKDEVEKSAGKASGQSTAATEEPTPAPSRRKSAASRTVSDARAELSQTPIEQDARPVRVQNTPVAATRWPDPVSTLSQANPAANPPAPTAAPVEQSAETRNAPAATPLARPQIMPRAVPPVPVSEKPISLPMLITIIAGGFSVLGVMVSLLLAWLASRRARRSPAAAMPPLELPDTPRRPGDLYRARKQMRTQRSGRRAA